MTPEPNTLLTTLYVPLTDRVPPDLGVSRNRRPVGKASLSDAELLCLAVAQQLLGYSSETRWIRYARTRLTGMFPSIPQQPGYNKRLRAAGTLISATEGRDQFGRDTVCRYDDHNTTRTATLLLA